MLALCREHRLEHRTKHIALRYFLARELQQRGQLRLTYVASEANTADIFTKALAPGDHQRFCTLLACFALLDWSCDPLFSPTLPMGYLDAEGAENAVGAVAAGTAPIAAIVAAPGSFASRGRAGGGSGGGDGGDGGGGSLLGVTGSGGGGDNDAADPEQQKQQDEWQQQQQRHQQQQQTQQGSDPQPQHHHQQQQQRQKPISTTAITVSSSADEASTGDPSATTAETAVTAPRVQVESPGGESSADHANFNPNAYGNPSAIHAYASANGGGDGANASGANSAGGAGDARGAGGAGGESWGSQRFYTVTGEGDYCAGESHWTWSFLCAAAEAKALNRTLIIPMARCLDARHTLSHLTEEKPMVLYYAMDHWPRYDRLSHSSISCLLCG
ncbi:unnamed protein product [Closterium sp. NIES-53]